jgi:uncharacterized protein YndB with AHSA1/START domain
MTGTPAHPDGTVEERDGRRVLRYERHLEHPVERVWAAVTDPGELVGWLGEADIDLVPGGRVEIRWLNTDDEGNRAVARGAITALDPPRLLEVDTDLHGVLRWELAPAAGGGTVLRFTNITPAPDEFVAKVLAGWAIHLDHLEDALDGHHVDWAAWTPETRARRSGKSWADHERRGAELAGRT